MVWLLHLKHTFGESVVQKWAENPYWQFFCGGEYFETRLPCDPSNLTRFRQGLGTRGWKSSLPRLLPFPPTAGCSTWPGASWC